jgi:hypothetical protein
MIATDSDAGGGHSTPPRTGAPRRFAPTIGFALALLSLLVAGIMGVLPPRLVSGLPDDPEIVEIRHQIAGLVPVAYDGFRFRSSLVDDPGPPDLPPPETMQQIDEAERRMSNVLERHPGEPRLLAALGALDLARRRLEPAETRFREAVGRSHHYGEGRLGLGVAMALRAEHEPEGRRARRIRLEALAQFATVRENDPAYVQALYDRVLLLARLGRSGEARRWANEYVARDSTSTWGEEMRGIATGLR